MRNFTTASHDLLVRVERAARFARAQITAFVFVIFVSALSTTAAAQRIAVLAPEKTELASRYVDTLTTELRREGKVVDREMAEASYVSAATENPYNITATQAREIGTLIGCDLFVFIKSAVQRRSSFSKPEFYEAFAAIYLVSSRTGRLASWQLESYEAAKPVFAEDMLLKSVPAVAGKLRITASHFMADEVARSEPDRFDPLPDEGSPNAKGLRPPMPYKRIRPEYTPTAFLYDVRATVEIEVSIDAAGKVVSTDIVRWAGYGLDESVTRVILNMNWRPAERNGKQLPMRVLLRYNFTKIEKEDL